MINSLFLSGLTQLTLRLTTTPLSSSKLHNNKFISRYEIDGDKYIQVLQFSRHQNPHPHETKSIIPHEMSRQKNDKSRKGRDKAHTCRADSLLSLALADSLIPIKPSSGPLAAGLNVSAWETWVDYRKQIRKPLKPASILAAQRKLAAFGCDQSAVVEQSIANGWTGIFQLKNGGTHATHQHVDNSAPARVKRANERQREAERRRKPIDV